VIPRNGPPTINLGTRPFDPRQRAARGGAARDFIDPFDIFREVFGGGGGNSGIFESLFGGGGDPSSPQRGEDFAL